MKKNKRKVFLVIGTILICFLFFVVNSREDQNIIEETARPENSKDKLWWLNSGAYAIIDGGDISTIQGRLPAPSIWRLLYARNNPFDTKEGLYPQNVFRLLTKNIVEESTFETYAEIKKINEIDSPNRNESNGVLIFQRYQDSNNLYYAGIRVDGNAVIKKKINGTYYTLAEQKMFNGTYDRKKNVTLIPLQKRIGIRVITTDTADNSVMIHLFLDKEGSNQWEEVLETIDDGSVGGNPLQKKGRAGVRADFMDASFKKIRLSKEY